MAEYTLTVHVDEHWVTIFNKHNMRLSLAVGVNSGDMTLYTTIAHIGTVAATMTIDWRDEYYIAASKNAFAGCVKFDTSTTIQPIQFGQTFTLPQDWTDRHPSTDVVAPPDGFRFVNETEASCVLYKRIQNGMSPIYTSAPALLPPGHEDIIPKPACRIWFARAGADGTVVATMIDDLQSEYMEINLTGNTTPEVRYDATGTWLNV